MNKVAGLTTLGTRHGGSRKKQQHQHPIGWMGLVWQLVGWLGDWSVSWLVGWVWSGLAGRSVGRLVGWMVQTKNQPAHRPSQVSWSVGWLGALAWEAKFAYFARIVAFPGDEDIM